MTMREFSVVEAEDKFMTNVPDFSTSRPGLHPSEASVEYYLDGRKIVIGNCLRSAWYRNMSVPVPASERPGLMMKAALGKWIEQSIIDRWKAMGIWVANNIKFYNKELFLSGELDAIIKDPVIDQFIGQEIKSYYGHYAVKEICGSKRPPVPGQPKEDQFLQAVVYSWEFRDKLPEYRMYYVERGDGHRVEFKVGTEKQNGNLNICFWEQVPGDYWSYFKPGRVYRPYTIEDIHSRYKTLIALLKGKTLPPRDYNETWDEEQVEFMWSHGLLGKTKYEDWQKSPKKNPITDWHCSYCSYREQCKVDELTVVNP